MTVPRTIEQFRRLAAAQELEADPPGGGDIPSDVVESLRFGVAKIDSNDGDGEYTITEQVYDPSESTWGDVPQEAGYVSKTARDLNDREAGAEDQYVFFWEQWAEESTLEVLIDATAPASLFAVLVWRDGGTTNGDATTQCDRTYTAKTLDSAVTLDTALTPKKRRPTTGKLSVPSDTGDGEVGLAYYGADGTFCLFDANETLDTTVC